MNPMVKTQSLSFPYLFASTLMGLGAILCSGCAKEGIKDHTAYNVKIQRTVQSLIAAGDADSLAAAALLTVGPTANPAQRLMLITQAVSKAPDRADLVWLNIRICSQVDTCNPEPLEAQLRSLDPDNGAAWFDSIDRAGRRKDEVAVRKDLSAIAASRRFDMYWNTTVAHVTNAIVRTHTMDLPNALVDTYGMESGTAIPAYQTLLNACKADLLQDAERLTTCRQVSTVMRSGDIYLTELVGIAIAKRAWPEGSPEYIDAISARRVAHYRMDADGKLGLHRFLSPEFAAKRLQLINEKRTEQELTVAEIVNAQQSPDPPPDYVDR
jgi:hypothetical protein